MGIRHVSEESLSFAGDSKKQEMNNSSRLFGKIADVPDAPSISTATDVGTNRALNNGAVLITATSAVTGGAPASYTATSNPGSFTATGTSPVTVTGLASATSYTFSVSAANTTGSSKSSGSSGSITATTVPAEPTIGPASVVNATTVSLAFIAPTSSGGKAITSYAVISNPSISVSASGTTSPLSITGSFASGQAYTFTLAAVNANGTSSYSGSSNSVTTN